MTYKSGVKSIRYQQLLRNIDDKSPEQQKPILDFLEAVYKNEYKAVIDIWTQRHINDDMWRMYRLLGATALPEFKELRICQQNLRDRWHGFVKGVTGKRNGPQKSTS